MTQTCTKRRCRNVGGCAIVRGSRSSARSALRCVATLAGAWSVVHAASAFGIEPPAATPTSETIAATRASGGFKQPIPAAAYELSFVRIPESSDGSIAPFMMSLTEVPWEAFDTFVYRLDEGSAEAAGERTPAVPRAGLDAVTRPSKPYLPPDRGFGHEGYPAIGMSSKNARAFCDWLSALSGKKFRLPTELEWEHAAAAGSAATYPFGDDAGSAVESAWFAENAVAKTHPVGEKQPNLWGLYDMAGNVQEWVIGADNKPMTKGGSFRDGVEKLATLADTPEDRAWNASDPQIPKSGWWLADGPFVGFRVVCEIAAEQGAREGTPSPAAGDAAQSPAGDAGAGTERK